MIYPEEWGWFKRRKFFQQNLNLYSLSKSRTITLFSRWNSNIYSAILFLWKELHSITVSISIHICLKNICGKCKTLNLLSEKQQYCKIYFIFIILCSRFIKIEGKMRIHIHLIHHQKLFILWAKKWTNTLIMIFDA